ncbi:MAG: nucleotidyltransferase domain-containing protein [bacterium]
MKTLNTLKLKKTEFKAVTELKKNILKLYPDAELILFGSKARGDFNEDSDVDVLILVDKINNYSESKISDIIYNVIFKYGIPLNETIAEKGLLKNSWTSQIPFYSNVNKEGVRI